MKTLIENALAFTLYYSGLIRILRNKGRNYPKILLYHSVSNTENYIINGTSDMWISVSNFRDHLQYLQKKYNIISLQALVASLGEGKIPQRTVVITFDDGFADNYHFAYPILKKDQIPVTIFLTTEAIDNRKPIWIQKVNYLVGEIGIDNVISRMRGYSYNPRFDVSLKPMNLENSLEKQFENYLAYNVSKQLREEILLRLFTEFNLTMENAFSENSIFLRWQQIKKMHANGICFGNHGESHTPFSALSEDQLKNEIVNSKTTIEQNLDLDFLPFAYPFGQEKDFTEFVREMVEKAGHSCILTAMPTLIRTDTEKRELGRIIIRNIPVFRLAYELEKGVIKSWLRR